MPHLIAASNKLNMQPPFNANRASENRQGTKDAKNKIQESSALVAAWRSILAASVQVLPDFDRRPPFAELGVPYRSKPSCYSARPSARLRCYSARPSGPPAVL